MTDEINKIERALMVYAMEYIARQINNEEIFASWLVGCVADGDIEYGDFGAGTDTSVDTEAVSYYIDDDNEFAGLMDHFLWLMKRAYDDGGLYCAGVVSKEEEV